MIITFIDHPNMVNAFMEVSGLRQASIYNLSSLYSGYESISGLITNINPINMIGIPLPEFIDSYEFDCMYANTVFSNDALFVLFMHIIFHAYEGNVVFVLVHRDPYRDSVMESIIKIIQQRYGCQSWIINDVEDIYYIKDELLSAQGVETIEQDIMRYKNLCGPSDFVSIEY